MLPYSENLLYAMLFTYNIVFDPHKKQVVSSFVYSHFMKKKLTPREEITCPRSYSQKWWTLAIGPPSHTLMQ